MKYRITRDLGFSSLLQKRPVICEPEHAGLPPHKLRERIAASFSEEQKKRFAKR